MVDSSTPRHEQARRWVVDPIESHQKQCFVANKVENFLLLKPLLWPYPWRRNFVAKTLLSENISEEFALCLGLIVFEGYEFR